MKNEATRDLIVRHSYQFERTLGKSDTAKPYDQREYLVGSVMNTWDMVFAQGDKLVSNFSFMSVDQEFRDSDTAPKTGDRPVLISGEAYNATSNVKRFGISVITPGDAAPDDLFAYMEEMTITVNNNVAMNKAVKVFGAFDTTAGMFEVSQSVTAYFANVAAMQTVRNNPDVTTDVTIGAAKQGWTIDLPVIGVSNAPPDVEEGAPIMLELTNDAGHGAKYGLNYTVLFVFWDYLPDSAK